LPELPLDAVAVGEGGGEAVEIHGDSASYVWRRGGARI
jgi:hypothetical protein